MQAKIRSVKAKIVLELELPIEELYSRLGRDPRLPDDEVDFKALLDLVAMEAKREGTLVNVSWEVK